MKNVRANTDVNIRPLPTTAHAPIGLLRKGEILPLAKQGTSWHEVNFNSRPAYISAAHTTIENAPIVPAAIVGQRTYKETQYRTNKVSIGRNTKEFLVFHHSAGGFQSGINTILNTDRQAGYHCFIDTNGDRAIFNNLDAILWHCGQSQWQGRTNMNRFSIGVCFTGDTTKRTLNDNELQSMVEWLRPLWGVHNFSIDRCVTHAQIATPRGRKIDVSSNAMQQILSALRINFK